MSDTESTPVEQPKSAPADRASAGTLDEAEANAVRPYVDLGGVKILPRPELGLRLEVEEGSKRVVAVALQGDPASEIIDHTRKTPNSLVAMSTHGRAGIGRWVLGSVAERVVQHSQDPVLLIRAK